MWAYLGIPGHTLGRTAAADNASFSPDKWGERPTTLNNVVGGGYVPDMIKRPALESPPIGRTLKAAHQAARSLPNTEIVKAGELVEARFARGVSPSAAARKVLALLIQKAAGDAWKPGPHSIPKRDLRGSHNANDRLNGILDELQRTLLQIKTVAPDRRAAAMVAPLMAYRIEHLEDDDRSQVWWEFSDLARQAMQGSDYFAALNRGILLAFASRYAVTLYERGCLLAGRRDPCWRGTVNELRETMGVPANRYRDWADIRARVVEPACAEVNQIADFVVDWKVKHGPRNKVVAVELRFRSKDEAGLNAAAAELNSSRIGRKARRQNRVETVLPLTLPPPKDPSDVA